MARKALIVGLGLLLVAGSSMAGISGTDLWVPSLARVYGAHGSQWYATVWIHNPGTQAAQVHISYLARDQSNPSPIVQTVRVDPGETLRFEDVFQDVFGLSDAKGALRFLSDRKVVVYGVYGKNTAASAYGFLGGLVGGIAYTGVYGQSDTSNGAGGYGKPHGEPRLHGLEARQFR